MKAKQTKPLVIATLILGYIVYVMRSYLYYSGMNYAGLPGWLNVAISCLSLIFGIKVIYNPYFQDAVERDSESKFMRTLMYLFTPALIFGFIYAQIFVAIHTYEEYYVGFREFQSCHRLIESAYRDYSYRSISKCEITIKDPPAPSFKRIKGNLSLCSEFKRNQILRLTFQESENGRRSLKYFDLAPHDSDLETDCFKF